MLESDCDHAYNYQGYGNNSSHSIANSNHNNQNGKNDKENNFAWIYCRSLTKYRQSRITPPVVDPGSMDSEQPAVDNISMGDQDQNIDFSSRDVGHQNEQEFYPDIRRNHCYS